MNFCQGVRGLLLRRAGLFVVAWGMGEVHANSLKPTLHQLTKIGRV